MGYRVEQQCIWKQIEGQGLSKSTEALEKKECSLENFNHRDKSLLGVQGGATMHLRRKKLRHKGLPNSTEKRMHTKNLLYLSVSVHIQVIFIERN